MVIMWFAVWALRLPPIVPEFCLTLAERPKKGGMQLPGTRFPAPRKDRDVARWAAHQWALIGITALCVAGCQVDGEAVESERINPSSLYGAEPEGSASAQGVGKGAFNSRTSDPLAVFSLSANEQAVVDQARASLMTQCMRERGYTGFEAPLASEAEGSQTTLFGDFGLQDVDRAREFGYHPRTVDGVPVNVEGEADSGTTVLGGTGELPQNVLDESACLDLAVERLDQGTVWDNRDLEQYERFMSTALNNARSSDRLAAAVKHWSGCMEAKGFSYSEPTEPATAAWPLDVGEKEKQTAVADVECKRDVGLLSLWDEVFADCQRDLVEEYRPALEAMHERDLSRLSMAQEVLAST
jgi:hypothetical protein